MKKPTCRWKLEEDAYGETMYETSCGDGMYFEELTTVEENGFKFCPYCGRKIGVKQ